MRTNEQQTTLYHALHEHYSRMALMYGAGYKFRSRGCVRHVRYLMRTTVN